MPELQPVSRSRRSKPFRLAGERTVIGRHPACNVVIDDASVSRQHAMIMLENGEAFIEDLRSRNGTSVNGRRITGRQRLTDGDEVGICDQRLRFQSSAGGPTTGAPADRASDGDDIVDSETHDSVIVSQLDVGDPSGEAAGSVTSEAKLRAIVRLHRAIGGSVSLDEVLPRLLDGLFAIFPQADRGFVLLVDATSQRPVVRASRLKGAAEPGPLRLSLSLIDKVLQTKRAILSADAVSDSRFSASESIVDYRIRSVMCVPLLHHDGHVLGVIHVDSRDLRERFVESDLELLAGIAVDAGRAIEQAAAHEQRITQEQLKRDLELAYRVQQGLLPSKPPEIAGYEVFDFYEPALQIGGDFFAYVPLADGRIAIVLADVSGKGVSAALVMAALSADVRYCLASDRDVAVAVSRINDGFSRSGWDDRFATLIVAVLEPATGAVTLVNAGHLPAFIRDAAGTVRAVGAEQAGLPMGVDREHVYGSCPVTLATGDMLLLYTDGISEAMDLENRCYGLDRLMRIFADPAKTVEEVGRRILGDVERHAAGQIRSDDICLVCLGRMGGAAEHSAQRPRAVRGSRGIQSAP